MRNSNYQIHPYIELKKFSFIIQLASIVTIAARFNSAATSAAAYVCLCF
jgi:hypothetical protein